MNEINRILSLKWILYYFLVCFSAGDDDGLHWNKASCPASFSLNTTPTENVENLKESSIWINANKLTLASLWSEKSINSRICSMWKLQEGHIIWQPILKMICVHGLIVFARFAIYKRPSLQMIGNVSIKGLFRAFITND